MPPSSDSLSSTSLPFGADIHNHATWRSGSVPRSVQHEYKPAIYDQGPQTYSALIAAAQASDAVSRRPDAQIPPSSIRSIPRSHKKVLRQHRILFRVLIGVFHISLVALTAAIVLGAVEANQHGRNGATCAAIIVGVFAFSGVVGSAAVIWLIHTGRKERARLEKRWVDEERAKEERSVRERQRERDIRESIKDRERSLSRSRSRGRDRDRIARPAVIKVPPLGATTPTPTSSARKLDHNVQPVSRRVGSPWPSPLDVTSDIDDDLDSAIDEDNNTIKHHEGGIPYDNNGNGSGQDESKDKDGHGSGHDKEGKVQATPETRDSVPTDFLDLDPSDSEDDDTDNSKEATTSPSNIAIPEQKPSNASLSSSETKLLPPLPPSLPAPAPLTSTSTTINPPPTSPPPTTHPKPPTTPTPSPDPPTKPPSHSTSTTTTTPSPTTIIPRLHHGGLGPAQSDANFQAMLDSPDDAGSEDEEAVSARRGKKEEWIRLWARGAGEGGGGEGEGGGGGVGGMGGMEVEKGVGKGLGGGIGAGEREEKGKRLRIVLEKGVRRVQGRKMERRRGGVGGGVGDGRSASA
ncbi:hypothetical protein IMSHALPRED_005108 [Imshaugia aleurites]|uniref:Uncharacterized protein n=1 Tax=Imshaugia aleurites TaxID=172621 RepID=A0A8H3FAY5_9LECA|nr:hypothetical protein IMSHALPRED_005108 [Imshaugia aleurites]